MHSDSLGEAQKAIEMKRSTTTFFIIKHENEYMIWVSSFLENGNVYFVSECLYPGEVSSWFGISKKQGIVNYTMI